MVLYNYSVINLPFFFVFFFQSGLYENDSIFSTTGDKLDELSEVRHLYPLAYPQHLRSSCVKKRVARLPGPMTPGTAMDMVKSLTILGRWMWSKYKDERQLEKIPAPDLDKYLKEFFLILKKENGTWYEPGSFRKHRYCINRYLKENRYPFCIASSAEFLSSRCAFTHRMCQLCHLFKKTK